MMTLGIQRESLQNNPLLQKSELGKPLKRCFNLPPDDFTYGRPNLYSGNGTADALCSWNVVKPRRVSTAQPEERDFVRLNKMAVQAGLTSAPEQYQFRATHDVKVSSGSKERSLNKLKKIPPSAVFGISRRPSTPVFDLLAHKYQEKWLEERRKAEEALRVKQDQKKQVTREIYETRASLLENMNLSRNYTILAYEKISKGITKLESFEQTEPEDFHSSTTSRTAHREKEYLDKVFMKQPRHKTVHNDQ
ncbi:cilia- and flagella-associated protein 77-like [Xenia sp. Carnegie-2017]|uniref:cilia- and flagella-associated protein 77-like n=1 Tax=Xenia sp. Carnegie-2017 TaxID=2897299 RepID=UPI001F03FFA0|nr:cilia- and flagella-associated protein 77-like [Xenia sp. Carnegie-2017]